LYNTATIEPRN